MAKVSPRYSCEEKRKLFELLLERGSKVAVGVNAQVRGVVLPDHLMGDPQVTLHFVQGIQMVLSPDGIGAILSFDRVKHTCTIPWNSVFAITPLEEDDFDHLMFDMGCVSEDSMMDISWKEREMLEEEFSSRTTLDSDGYKNLDGSLSFGRFVAKKKLESDKD